MDIKKRNIYIKLFEKFRKNELTQNEISDFANLFTDNSEQDSLEKYYTEIWDLSSKRHSDVKSNVLFSKIKKSITKKEPGEISEVKEISVKSRFTGFALKYAAVFIIAFLSAWFGRKIFIEGKTSVKYSEENIVEVSYGSKSQIQLPDGSTVNLNSGSRISYPTTFQNGKRVVNLSGEAFFQVEADEKSPFYVHTSDLTVRVTGTKFNISSYPDSKSIETTLVTGKLQILDKKKKNRTLAVLSPNETAVFDKPSFSKNIDAKRINQHPYKFNGQKSIHVKNESNTCETYAWKYNLLVFNNQSLQDLAIRLERWYDVNIHIQDKELANERFTGKFDKETIEQALKALQLIVPFDYEINKNKITISSER